MLSSSCFVMGSEGGHECRPCKPGEEVSREIVRLARELSGCASLPVVIGKPAAVSTQPQAGPKLCNWDVPLFMDFSGGPVRSAIDLVKRKWNLEICERTPHE